MNVLLTLNLEPTDRAIRRYIRQLAPLPQTNVQQVICEDPRYADRTFAAWLNRKLAKGLPCGGGWHEAYPPVK